MGFCVLFLLWPHWTQAQEDAFRYLEPIEKKYAGLKDYTADGVVHFDIETFKAPDMGVKLYYKAPDKMKVESKRILFFPREGGFFNPSLFKKEGFEIKFLERFTYEGARAVKLQLTPQKPKRNTKEWVVTIDTDHNLIREIGITQYDGREIKAVIHYGTFDGFELPFHIRLTLDLPSFETEGPKEFDQWVQKPKRVTGTIDIRYSNYKVNRGLRDELFVNPEGEK